MRITDISNSATKDILIAWRRWYEKAIKKSANQIYGAEQWLLKYPDRVFLDKKCDHAFPITMPIMEEAFIHRILITHGITDACLQYYDGGSGSLPLNSTIIGE